MLGEAKRLAPLPRFQRPGQGLGGAAVGAVVLLIADHGRATVAALRQKLGQLAVVGGLRLLLSPRSFRPPCGVLVLGRNDVE